MNPKKMKKEITNSCLAIGIVPEVPRLWRASRNVVRKWASRFEKDGKAGLKDKL